MKVAPAATLSEFFLCKVGMKVAGRMKLLIGKKEGRRPGSEKRKDFRSSE